MKKQNWIPNLGIMRAISQLHAPASLYTRSGPSTHDTKFSMSQSGCEHRIGRQYCCPWREWSWGLPASLQWLYFLSYCGSLKASFIRFARTEGVSVFEWGGGGQLSFLARIPSSISLPLSTVFCWPSFCHVTVVDLDMQSVGAVC
jgi:hypothetical protein